jgi:hypothetical protein
VAAERVDVAEQHRDRQAPGDRAERQEVAAEAQRQHADQQRRHAGQQQREGEAEPRREALRRRQPGGRIGGDADERGLAERRRAADAGQQHETERDQRADADVVEQRDRERAGDGRRERERDDDEAIHTSRRGSPGRRRSGAHVAGSAALRVQRFAVVRCAAHRLALTWRTAVRASLDACGRALMRRSPRLPLRRARSGTSAASAPESAG